MIDTVQFRGIDNFHRPVFKSVKYRNHYGCTDTLFDRGASEKEVLEKMGHLTQLTFFGSRFGCEPTGGKFDVIILKSEEDTTTIDYSI